MTTFLQIHMLTSYPPSNLNRDDLGRPKTAVMGGANRLRISSQSLKRSWRTSRIFETHVKPEHVGTRTKEMGRKIFQQLTAHGVGEEDAKAWARKIAEKFGKPKKPTKKAQDKQTERDRHQDLDIEQLAHFSPLEEELIDNLVQKIARTHEPPTDEDVELLRKEHTAADIALFGRMLAADPRFNTEAAAQVAHAITVHRTAVQEDFFTAVDDLNQGEVDRGSAHMGELEFGAGLFYLYLCIDCESLVTNLSGHKDLARNAIAGLLEAAAKVSPTGKQNSFASRAYASYILAERGEQQPRSLSVAFLKPVTGEDMLADAILRLEDTRACLWQAYGPCWEGEVILNTVSGAGTLDDVLAFGKGCVQ